MSEEQMAHEAESSEELKETGGVEQVPAAQSSEPDEGGMDGLAGEVGESNGVGDEGFQADGVFQPADAHTGEQPVAAAELVEKRDPKHPRGLDFLLDIPLELSIEVGRTKLEIRQLLNLGPGSVIELDKLAGEPLDVYANNRMVARGEVVVINEKFGLKLTEVVSPRERIENLE